MTDGMAYEIVFSDSKADDDEDEVEEDGLVGKYVVAVDAVSQTGHVFSTHKGQIGQLLMFVF